MGDVTVLPNVATIDLNGCNSKYLLGQHSRHRLNGEIGSGGWASERASGPLNVKNKAATCLNATWHTISPISQAV